MYSKIRTLKINDHSSEFSGASFQLDAFLPEAFHQDKELESEKTLPIIYTFSNFRTYLREYQEMRKKWDASFTKSRISKLLGLPNTRSFFSEVIAGRRTVSTMFIDRFIQLLKLDKNESQYFRTLVHYNQAENTDERELFLDQLGTLKKSFNR